jgi:hypothetical protein
MSSTSIKQFSSKYPNHSLGQPSGIYGEVSAERILIVLRIQLALSRDLLPADLMFGLPTNCHITRGHCAAATEAAYHLFGKKKSGYQPYVWKDSAHNGTNTHWWLFNRKTGALVDPTAEQIDGDPTRIYHRGHHQNFRTSSPSKVAAEIIRRVRKQHKYSREKLLRR